MSITFSCSHCQSKMTVPDNLAGKKGNCSKCKGAIIVPAAANGHAPRPAAPAKPAPPKPTAATPPPPPPKPIDVEAAALEALSDAPAEQAKALEAIEFTCPQCDEPIKMPLDQAGKRAPCPSCSRIIAVPVPQAHKEKNWRDTGPKKPEGAKRDIGPELEGAWGTDKAAGLSQEAAEEAGLIPEKERPLTFYQRYQTHLMIGVPTLIVLVAAYYGWNWWAAGKEARMYHAGLTYATSEAGSKTDPVALAGLRVGAGLYQSRTPGDGSADRAKEQYAAALGALRSARGAARDAVLVDVARRVAALGGEGDDVGRGARLKWDESQKLAKQALSSINYPEARVDALRAVAGPLVRAGHGDRAMALAAQVAGDDAERFDLLAAVGLEMVKAGQREAAEKIAKDVEAAFPPIPEEKEKGKAKGPPRPPLRPRVVQLSVALERKPPGPAPNLVEREAHRYGTAAGLAQLGKLKEAEDVCKGATTDSAQLASRIYLLAACDKPSAENLATALPYLNANRNGLEWELLRMLEAALRADANADDVNKIVESIPTPVFKEWGKLLVIRHKARGRAAIPMDEVEKVNVKTTAGLLARLEAARQNAWMDPGWAGTVNGWEEPARAFGSVGAALGLQGGRDDR
jgi:hypothetical protein